MHHWSFPRLHYPAYFTYFYLDSFRNAFQITSSSIRDIQNQSFRFLLKTVEHWDTWMCLRKLHSQGILTSFTWSSHMQYLVAKWDLPATSAYTAGKAGTSVSIWQLTTSVCCPNGNWISTTMTEIGTILPGAMENYVKKWLQKLHLISYSLLFPVFT